ncbi:MAG: hypothetical protein NTY36_16865 [Deltaproteobacteria bacterium]|nr:hypothetical protein [Deltaproteobacteria bacterium]
MSEDQIQRIMDGMEPEAALAALARAAGRLFPLLGDEALFKFVVSLVGQAEGDKVASMVHL